MKRFLVKDNGQTSVDYMLTIALIAIAIIAAVHVFITPVTRASGSLAENHANGMVNGRAQ